MAATRKASEIRAARRQLRAVTAVRRSVFYFMRAILIILLIGALCIFSFVFGSRLSNAYILVNEGMSMRAECILKNTPENELTVYFTAQCIQEDADERAACAAPYADMTVSSYEYRLKISEMHILPWHINMYVDVVEQVRSVKGTVSADSGSGTTAASWTPRRYRLHLGKTDGRWMIESVELLELNPKLEAPATPDPEAEPLPIVTPSPVPTNTPLPTNE